MDYNRLLNLQGMLFLLVAAGVVLRKKGILPEGAKSILTDLVIYLILPCNIINSFFIEFNLDILKGFAVILTIAGLIQIGCLMFAKVFYNREPESRKKSASVWYGLFQCGLYGKSHRRRRLWGRRAHVCFHISDPSKDRYVVCRGFVFYGKPGPEDRCEKGFDTSLYHSGLYWPGSHDHPAASAPIPAKHHQERRRLYHHRIYGLNRRYTGGGRAGKHIRLGDCKVCLHPPVFAPSSGLRMLPGLPCKTPFDRSIRPFDRNARRKHYCHIGVQI